MRLFQAISVFFKVLFDGDFATAVKLTGSDAGQPALPASESTPAPKPKPAAPKPPARNDAITLLATLQREARFVDIVMEPLGEYTDAQVGAATRDVLRDCGKTLDRLFALEPISESEEGSSHEIPADYDTARYRMTGNVSGNPPYKGQLVHHGWQAAHCELPKWLGDEDSALVVAPVEIEIA